ncbi:MerR family transcriptional regulator [Lactiplantibacillus songbeiensis]|uniref:MerR family transcriptional regulator n=1 Tax=Lactiplantibacillus songbeiensis TaxID=2559920 RepID=A0ABW4C1C2_9LACO|nr:MerR family transcriptional regulator [Lactiplantibacillus songbeiensis]
MSEYTTGELAKLAQVSVRTIQYYDQRQLLRPTATTTGGRRLYTAADLDRLKLILLLKGLGLSLKSIQAVLASDEATAVLHGLLQVQVAKLQAQQALATQQLARINQLQAGLNELTSVPIKSITDITQLMTNQQGLQRVHWRLLVGGGLLDVLELTTLVWGIVRGQWWPLGIAVLMAIIGAAGLVYYYFGTVNYRCPHCQAVFRPTFWQGFWARHTLKTRRLTCPNCHERHFCIEQFKA